MHKGLVHRLATASGNPDLNPFLEQSDKLSDNGLDDRTKTLVRVYQSAIVVEDNRSHLDGSHLLDESVERVFVSRQLAMDGKVSMRTAGLRFNGKPSQA